MIPVGWESRRTVRVVATVAFLVGLALWTWKLLESNPVPTPIREFLSIWDWLPFILAKSLHAGGYAFLAFTGWIAVGRRFGQAIVAFLVLHGIGTEIGQTFIPNRFGSVKDVFIDAAGTLTGTLTYFLLRKPTASLPDDDAG
ncbi:MAG: VanZ family protein [Fimbriiglobus sp.]